VIPDDLVKYVDEAIRRVSADTVASGNGSHAAGIFNKAANGFEKRFAAFVTSATHRSNLDRRTLGALIQVVERLPNAGLEPLKGIIAGAKEVNEPWKKLKHGDDPPVAELLNGLRRMQEVLLALPT
jgi:hypothetical protein